MVWSMFLHYPILGGLACLDGMMDVLDEWHFQEAFGTAFWTANRFSDSVTGGTPPSQRQQV